MEKNVGREVRGSGRFSKREKEIWHRIWEKRVDGPAQEMLSEDYRWVTCLQVSHIVNVHAATADSGNQARASRSLHTLQAESVPTPPQCHHSVPDS